MRAERVAHVSFSPHSSKMGDDASRILRRNTDRVGLTQYPDSAEADLVKHGDHRYEPPFFVAADANQKLRFDTKDKSQVPDKTSIGHMETGFHS